MVTPLLKGVAIDPVRLCCHQNTCLGSGHRDAIDGLLSTLIRCIIHTGETVFDKRRSWRHISSWNEVVQEATVP